MVGHGLAVILSVFFVQINSEKNNVCPTYNDYFNMENNTNCWYNPDVVADTVQIIKNHNYPVEIHHVTTQDGYILTLHRIPRKNAKEVVVFQPPMTGTGANYLKAGNISLGFSMHDAGYDVWLCNSRGSYYSRNHTVLNENQTKYWDFSFHEIGVYDFPAEFELIKNITKRNDLIVISYSMGGTALLIYASLLPQHALEHVKIFIPLGPTIYNRNDIGTLPGFLNVEKVMVNKKSKVTAFSSFEEGRTSVNRHCASHRMKFYCIMLGAMNGGGTPSNFDPAIVPVLYTNYPLRVSLKIIQHYYQIGTTFHFRPFNYGPVVNMMRYNSATPPDYPLKNITVPIYIIHGDQDRSCSIQSVDLLTKWFSETAKKYGNHIIKSYNHFDYLYSKTSKAEVTDHILRFIKEHF